MIEKKRRLSFPMYAEYNLPIRYIAEVGLEITYIMQPRMTKRTIELGDRYSPDFVCTPFKTCLGSMIEAIETGADTICMTYGLCRLGYFGELQDKILKELGYECDFINLTEYNTGKPKDILRALKVLNPKYKIRKVAAAALDGVRMTEYIDEIEDDYYKNCGFEVVKGSHKKVYDRFLNAMGRAMSRSDIQNAYREAKTAMAEIELNKPKQPLRVGIIGEYYTVMDRFSNLDLEQKLADMGVEVHRWMKFTNRNIHYPGEKNMNIRIKDLCTYEMGPTSTANIWCARDYAEKGFDGIIHVKSAGCTPEIDIMPVLQNISTDYKIPILYLTYDTQTSDTGLVTRLEAFYDMIDIRKQHL